MPSTDSTLAARARGAAARNDRPAGQVERTEQQQPPTLAGMIEQLKPELARALPKHVSPDRIVRVALTALRKTPALGRCTPESFLGALMTATQLGLEVNTPTGEAYLIPYGNECTFVVGYAGLAKLFWQSPHAKHLDAQAVYERDEFDYAYGLDPHLSHRPASGDRGALRCYYAVATLSNGGSAFVVLSPEDCKALRGGKVGPDARFKGGDPMKWMERKGLALDTELATPRGWTTMGDIREGDTVFDMHGQPVRVTETSPIKNIGCYRLTFSNGATVVCDEEHFWVARIGMKQGRTGWDTHPIAELYEAKRNGKTVTVPVAEPLQTPAADLPIDPWLLGYWLGDGNRSLGRLSAHQDDVDDVRLAIETAGYTLGAVRPDPRSKAVDMTVLGLQKRLADLGVLGHKHVPELYLRGSVEQRRALLRGLMDADGWIDSDRGRALFGNTNQGLTDAVAELARSLGEQVNRNVQAKTGFGRTVDSYVVQWQPIACPFTLNRKAERFRRRQLPPYRSVVSIERIESVPTRCIAVDSPTRTYLASPDMIPTHNTAVRQVLKLLPKSIELAAAIAADEHVRTDYSSGLDALTVREPDAIETGQVVDADPVTGEIADAEPGDVVWPQAAAPGSKGEQ